MTNVRPVIFTLGTFLSMMAGFMLIPLGLALAYGEDTSLAFLVSAVITGFFASVCLHQGHCSAACSTRTNGIRSTNQFN